MLNAFFDISIAFYNQQLIYEYKIHDDIDASVFEEVEDSN